MHEMLASLIHWYLEALDQGGYWLIGLLMAMESSILPVPSEFVIPPAAYLAHSNGTFTLTGIVIAGTVGSWVGASVMYWASYLIGRPLLMKYGRYVMITPEKIQQAEAWSSHYGMVGVFISRYRSVATLGIFLLMIAFLPIHVIDAFHDEPAIGSKALAYVRLPLQFVLIGWAWFVYKRGS